MVDKSLWFSTFSVFLNFLTSNMVPVVCAPVITNSLAFSSFLSQKIVGGWKYKIYCITVLILILYNKLSKCSRAFNYRIIAVWCTWCMVSTHVCLYYVLYIISIHSAWAICCWKIFHGDIILQVSNVIRLCAPVRVFSPGNI